MLITVGGYIAVDVADVKSTGQSIDGASFEVCNTARLNGSLGEALIGRKMTRIQENTNNTEIEAEYCRLRSVAPRWTPAVLRDSVIDTFALKWGMAKDEVAEIVDSYIASSQRKMVYSTTEPTWMLGASLVENTFEALEAASGDAPYILERDDLDEAAAWVIADVPIGVIKIANCRESSDERQKRLQAVRNAPPDELFRPILSGSITGSLELLDGGHRIEVAVERGLTHISALVKLDFIPAMQEQSNKIRSRLRA